MAAETVYILGGFVLAFLIGKFYPQSYKKIILIASPFITLAVILVTEYTKDGDNSLFSFLLFVLIPLYLLIGLVVGAAALIPGFLGARFGKKEFEYEQQYDPQREIDQTTNF